MRVYFYHTQNLNFIAQEWEKGKFPAHLLYGATHLKDEGIEVVMHKAIDGTKPRLWRMLSNAWQILTRSKSFDAIYSTRHNGIEIIIALRALGLFKKPIVCWHHQPVEKSGNFLKEFIARKFYKGIDFMFFFSKRIEEVSLASGRITTSKTSICPWGADLDYYDRLMKSMPCDSHNGFISTGKELRDMPTLIKAFEGNPDLHLDLITAISCGINYEKLFNVTSLPANISLKINREKRYIINDLAMAIWPHQAICICCKETNYTVGLTTLVEALAFGLPVIISKNPNQPFDVSEEGCGISVPYGDVEGWKNALRFIADNPDAALEMGRKGRKLAERKYNVKTCAHTVAEVLKQIFNDKA